MDPNHMLPRPGERQRPSSKQNRFDPTRDLSSPPSYAPPSYQNHPQSRAELLPPILPPAAVHHDPASNKLPSLSSLTGPPPPSRNPPPIPTSRPSTSTSISSSATTKTAPAPQEPAAPAITHWPSMNPFTTYYTPSHVQQAVQSPAKMDVDTTSSAGNSHTGTSPDRLYDARSVSVSLDDPEVRLAAEALGDLRADFVNSPLLGAPPSYRVASPPLFSLLTTSHPLLATTIEGATSAYNNSKNFSPRFKTSAEYVEGYLTPIANTVGSVGRVTGVEGGVRWFLGEGRRPSDLEAGQGSSNKRRKVRGDDMVGVVVDPAAHILAAAAVAEQESNRDSYLFKHDRRLSRASTIDTLPAYDESRSPAYTEDDKQNAQRGSAAEARKSRLVISTSGLAVSMSKESLRSLKYCLRWLRLANDHIGGVVGHLKTTLEQYDKAAGPGQEVKAEQSPDGETMEVDGRTSNDTEHQEDPTVLAARITALKADILKNLQAAIETVSKYAGGALPENARVLVHRQITSLPQRFRYASMVEQQQNQEGGERQREEITREGANRVLVLAKEGLDMITQVSGVIDGTMPWGTLELTNYLTYKEKAIVSKAIRRGEHQMGSVKYEKQEDIPDRNGIRIRNTAEEVKK
ncbi:Clock-controlled protein 8 like [Verticillium longisporum]|uniref:Clock-controlled protein 8 like n=1 Tax=Verticillium longisporum TaxID=100787 RepID=A0A8I3AIH0_VERLO|nr:Clock-controlled protein 8 like [Verticillium longisporum]